MNNLTSLSGLGNLKEIGSDLVITDLNSLTTIQGLGSLETIGSDLRIGPCQSLLSLNGMHNLSSLGGNVEITMNRVLHDVGNFPVLEQIGGNLILSSLIKLEDISGLNALHSIGGYLLLENLAELELINGFTQLTDISGDLRIERNKSLKNLNAFESLNSIGGRLLLTQNDSLISVSRFGNSVTAGCNSIQISRNQMLTDCNAEMICSFLSNPGGTIDIYSNATGCNKHAEVVQSCGQSYTCLPFGNYYLSSQADVDAFPGEYPDCIDIIGSVSITGEDVVNLEGLSQIQSISGDLIIGRRDETNLNLLADLQGLNNISIIGGDLNVTWTDALQSLNGLNNLHFIGNNLILNNNYNLSQIADLGSLQHIGNDINISECPVLSSLNGLQFLDSVRGNLTLENLFQISSFNSLENLRWVGGTLKLNSCLQNTLLTGLDSLKYTGNGLELSEMGSIVNLDALSQLTNIGNGALKINDCLSLRNIEGIRNIAPESISRFEISGNTRLFHCEVESICGFLQIAPGLAYIASNRIGCNSVDEINEACLTVDSELDEFQSLIKVFPNPAFDWLTISLPDGALPDNVFICGVTGKLFSESIFNPDVKMVYVKPLPPGIYIIKVNTRNEIFVGKFIKG